MGHRLILELPDDLYELLANASQKNGKTPEQLVVAWLMAANGQHVKDPLEAFIGAFRSTIPGWPERHDQLFGQGLVEERAGN